MTQTDPAPTADEAATPTRRPFNVQLPGFILLGAIWAAFLLKFNTGMIDWAISMPILSAGRYETLVLHMFAHAGLLHIAFNSYVLFILAGPIASRMGHPPLAWLRFFGFYALAGLAGAAVYLVLNQNSDVPMLGASGAISGLIGIASRLSDRQSQLIPIFSREMAQRIWSFAKANVLLILLITVPIMLAGGSGGIAWEAHLGGFAAGIFGARLFIKPARFA